MGREKIGGGGRGGEREGIGEGKNGGGGKKYGEWDLTQQKITLLINMLRVKKASKCHNILFDALLGRRHIVSHKLLLYYSILIYILYICTVLYTNNANKSNQVLYAITARVLVACLNLTALLK